ncbi:MAG: GHKL domain-containing protein [Ruminococcus sp.]|nr:GHKL domain-containing protein [Ruminococcus sp.]
MNLSWIDTVNIAVVAIQLLIFVAGVCAGMVLAGIDRTGNNAPWKIGFSLSFSLTLFAYGQLLRLALEASLGIFGGLIPTGTLLGMAALCYFLHFSLIPKDVSIVVGIDGEQRRKLRTNLVVLAVIQIILLMGLIYLWIRLPELSFIDAIWATVSATISLLCFGYFFRLSINSCLDRVKALIDREYQRELQDFMQIIRSQRHDFNLHLQTVTGLINQMRYDECDAYISTIVGNVNRMNDLLPIQNPAVSALVYTFVELAKQDGVRLDVTVKDPMTDIGCSAYEMNTVIGNLLKNAIEEAKEKEPGLKYIKLLLMRRSRCTIIRVSNPCDKSSEELATIFDVGYTTKQSHEGIGLVTVRKICLKYGGTVYIEREEGVLHMIAKIPCASRV